MKLNLIMKKLVLAFIIIIVVGFVVIGVYEYFYPTHYKYNDKFVIGNTSETIQDKYGDFSHVLYYENGDLGTGAYFIGKQHDLPKFYIIEFDRNGIACEVYCDTRDWSYK